MSSPADLDLPCTPLDWPGGRAQLAPLGLALALFDAESDHEVTAQMPVDRRAILRAQCIPDSAAGLQYQRPQELAEELLQELPAELLEEVSCG